MEKLKVEVKKILFHDEQTKKAIFQGMTTIKRKNSTGKLVRVKSKETFRGTFMALYIGDEIQVRGRWEQHKQYGQQFLVVQYQKTMPQTIKGIQVFLKQTVKGVGDKRVQAITDAYGEKSLSMIAQDIKNLDIFTNLSAEQKAIMKEAVCDNLHFEALLSFMQMNDLDYTLAVSVYQKYKEQSVKRIKSNPYLLLFEKMASFSTCDQIAKKLDISGKDDRRLYAGVYSFIQEDISQKGNLYTKIHSIYESLNHYLKKKGKLGHVVFLEDQMLEKLKQLESDGILVSIENENHERVVYLKNNLYIENKIVEQLRRKIYYTTPRIRFPEEKILDFFQAYEKNTGMTLAENQKLAVKTLLRKPVSILTGGPGTGKTQTMAATIECIKKIHPDAVIHLCSPTGKAAKRMCELSGMEASTIHRLVKIFDAHQQPDDLLIAGDFLLVDEASMIDAFVFYRLLSALDQDIFVIIIGDHNQLPSVGPGLILRDLIGSGVIPVVTLDKIFRQAQNSAIIGNSHRILKEAPVDSFKFSKNKNGDFYFIERESAEQVQDSIVNIIKNLNKNLKIPLSDIQILSPVRGTLLGTEQLNRLIQGSFNPNQDYVEIKDTQLGQSDKVIHIQNNYDLNVFNGETGIVERLDYLDENMLTITYPDKDIQYARWHLEELELAYAITVHKSQGSEFPVVIMPIHDMVAHGLYQNLIYTAITRAKKKMILVGDKALFQEVILKKQSEERNSMIHHKLKQLI